MLTMKKVVIFCILAWFLFFRGYWFVLRVALYLLPSSLFTTTIGSLPSEEQICTSWTKQGQAKRLRTRTFLWLLQQVSEPSWEVRLWRWEFSHSLKMRWTLCFKIGKKKFKLLPVNQTFVSHEKDHSWKKTVHLKRTLNSWKATLAETRTYRVKEATE